MGTVHAYKLTGNWSGDRTGTGSLEIDGISTQFSIPSDLNGAGVGTNPEALLLGAAASCYLITLSLLLNNRKIPYVRIDLESQGFVENDHGLRYDRIEHRPTIVVDHPADEETLISLAEHAEHTCMISSAVRGNVDVTVHPTILVQTTSH